MNPPKKNWKRILDILNDVDASDELKDLVCEQIENVEQSEEQPMSWNKKHYNDMCDPAFMADYYGTYDGPELSGDPRYGDDWD